LTEIRPNLIHQAKVLNIIVSFSEALKLNLALDECLRKINKYKLSTKEGKKAAVNLVIHANKNRIAIAEAKIASR
jgi:hypothetical protein